MPSSAFKVHRRVEIAPAGGVRARIFLMPPPVRVPFSGVALAVLALALAAGCGGASESAEPAAAPQAASSAPVLTIIEPAPGSSSGHISLFRWEPVPGADGYRIRVTAATDQRLVWDSPVITETEAHLPNTIALEPESYFWEVTALKGGEPMVASAPSRFLVTP